MTKYRWADRVQLQLKLLPSHNNYSNHHLGFVSFYNQISMHIQIGVTTTPLLISCTIQGQDQKNRVSQGKIKVLRLRYWQETRFLT